MIIWLLLSVTIRTLDKALHLCTIIFGLEFKLHKYEVAYIINYKKKKL